MWRFKCFADFSVAGICLLCDIHRVWKVNASFVSSVHVFCLDLPFLRKPEFQWLLLSDTDFCVLVKELAVFMGLLAFFKRRYNGKNHSIFHHFSVLSSRKCPMTSLFFIKAQQWLI